MTQLSLDTMLDDGAVIYINGQEVFRIGMNRRGRSPTRRNANRTVERRERSNRGRCRRRRSPRCGRVGEPHRGGGAPDAPNPNPSSDVVWGGKLTATVTATPAQSPLRITEVNFNPPRRRGALLSSNDYEFIEVKNTGATPLSLDRDAVRRRRGVLVFPGHTPGARAPWA